jgi:HSP20 family protein
MEVNMANIIKRNNGTGLATSRSRMPFSDWVDNVLQNTLNRFFDDSIEDFDGMLTKGQVPVNIRETDNSYELEVMAPGLKKEDFSVNISNNMLTLSFEHKEENKQEREGYLRQEYRMQSFTRNFTLDETVDAEKISARYKDGVLHLSLPKKEGARKVTKSIEVK